MRKLSFFFLFLLFVLVVVIGMVFSAHQNGPIGAFLEGTDVHGHYVVPLDGKSYLSYGSAASDFSEYRKVFFTMKIMFLSRDNVPGHWGILLKEQVHDEEMMEVMATNMLDDEGLRLGMMHEIDDKGRTITYAHTITPLNEVVTLVLVFEENEPPRLYQNDVLIAEDYFNIGFPGDGDYDDLRFCGAASKRHGWDMRCYEFIITKEARI